MLGERPMRPMVVPFIPILGILLTPSSLARLNIIEVGRELVGVPAGVLFGVDDALSTLVFLALDRGVILGFRDSTAGVATSLEAVLGLFAAPSGVLFSIGEDPADTGEPTAFCNKLGREGH